MSFSRPTTNVEPDNYSPSTVPVDLSSAPMFFEDEKKEDTFEEEKKVDTREEPYRLFNADEQIIIEEYVARLMANSEIEIEKFVKKLPLYSIKLSIIHFIRECIEVISWLQKEEDGYTIFFYSGDKLPESLLYAVETAKAIDPSHHTERTLNLGINSFATKKSDRKSFAGTDVQHRDIKAHGRNIQVYIPISYAFNGSKSFKDMVTIINKLSAQNNLAAENINIFLGPTEDATFSISKNKERRKVMINSWIDATRKLFSDEMKINLLVHENYDIRNDNLELIREEWYRSDEIEKAKRTFISILRNYPVLESLLVKDAIKHLIDQIPKMGIKTQAPLSYVPPEESLLTEYNDEDFETFAQILAESISVENSFLRKSESEEDIFQEYTESKDANEEKSLLQIPTIVLDEQIVSAPQHNLQLGLVREDSQSSTLSEDEIKVDPPALNNLQSDTSGDDSDEYFPNVYISEDFSDDEFRTRPVRKSFFRRNDSDNEYPLPAVESRLDINLSTEELAKRKFIGFDKNDYKKRYRDDSKISDLIHELSNLKKLVRKSKCKDSKQDALKYISSKLDVIYNEQVLCPGFFSYTLFILLFDAVSTTKKSQTTFFNSLSFFNNESSLQIKILSLIRAMALKAFKINLEQLINSDMDIEIDMRQKIFKDALAEPLFSKFLRDALLQPQFTRTAIKIKQYYVEFSYNRYEGGMSLEFDTSTIKDWDEWHEDSHWHNLREAWWREHEGNNNKNLKLFGLAVTSKPLPGYEHYEYKRNLRS